PLFIFLLFHRVIYFVGCESGNYTQPAPVNTQSPKYGTAQPMTARVASFGEKGAPDGLNAPRVGKSPICGPRSEHQSWLLRQLLVAFKDAGDITPGFAVGGDGSAAAAYRTRACVVGRQGQGKVVVEQLQHAFQIARPGIDVLR